jgi:hypothetical protein
LPREFRDARVAMECGCTRDDRGEISFCDHPSRGGCSATNFARSAAVDHPLGNGSSLSPAASLSRPSGDRLTLATLVPPLAVNPRVVDAVVAGAGGTDGATEAKGHLPELQPSASASCTETIASERNETSRRRGIVFIIGRCCVPYYLLSGPKDNRVKRFASRAWDGRRERCRLTILKR